MEFDNDFNILAADFNLALNPVIDTMNYHSVNNPRASKGKILEIMDDLHLLENLEF